MIDPSLVKQHLNKIKKPSISMNFAYNSKPDDTKDILNSFIGGYPYISKDNFWPTCSACENDMVFLMQLRDIDPDKNVKLNTIFYCNCKIKEFAPRLYVYQYTNPNLDDFDASILDREQKPLRKYDIIYYPMWNSPNWLTLPLYNRELAEVIMSTYGNQIESRKFYEDFRYDNEYVADDPFNIISGYPEFISDPKMVSCHCCNQDAEFYFQFEPPMDLGLTFEGSVLYCFRCPNNSYHFVLN